MHQMQDSCTSLYAMCMPCLLDWKTELHVQGDCAHLSWKLDTMLGLSVHVPVSAADSLYLVTQSVSC